MKRITRPVLVSTVAEIIPAESWDDLPMIRQAVNDTADSFRKDGYHCPDFAQDGIVRAIQNRIQESQLP